MTVNVLSAEQAAIRRAAEGISEHAMTGAWRVIVARRGEKARTWYFHENDDARHKNALRRIALEWLTQATIATAQRAASPAGRLP